VLSDASQGQIAAGVLNAPQNFAFLPPPPDTKFQLARPQNYNLNI
jgi:hypothetical protein